MTAKRGTVYRAFDADDNLLYVGMTTRPLRERLGQHAKNSEWWKLHAHIEHDRALPIEEAFRSECDQIVQLNPRFNKNAGCAQGSRRDTTTAEQELQWRARYESGDTIEQIALDVGLSAPTVRRHLLAVATTMRPAARRKGLTPGKRAPKGANAPAVHVLRAGTRGAHRRRGSKRFA